MGKHFVGAFMRVLIPMGWDGLEVMRHHDSYAKHVLTHSRLLRHSGSFAISALKHQIDSQRIAHGSDVWAISLHENFFSAFPPAAEPIASAPFTPNLPRVRASPSLHPAGTEMWILNSRWMPRAMTTCPSDTWPRPSTLCEKRVLVPALEKMSCGRWKN